MTEPVKEVKSELEDIWAAPAGDNKIVRKFKAFAKTHYT